MEKVDSKPMLKTLKQAEFRWPVLGDALGREHQWSAEQWSLLKTLAEMRNQHGKSVLIRLYVSPDDKNSSHYIIKVRLGKFEDTLPGFHLSETGAISVAVVNIPVEIQIY